VEPPFSGKGEVRAKNAKATRKDFSPLRRIWPVGRFMHLFRH
jgi:hypothetical protein